MTRERKHPLHRWVSRLDFIDANLENAAYVLARPDTQLGIEYLSQAMAAAAHYADYTSGYCSFGCQTCLERGIINYLDCRLSMGELLKEFGVKKPYQRADRALSLGYHMDALPRFYLGRTFMPDVQKAAAGLSWAQIEGSVSVLEPWPLDGIPRFKATVYEFLRLHGLDAWNPRYPDFFRAALLDDEQLEAIRHSILRNRTRFLNAIRGTCSTNRNRHIQPRRSNELAPATDYSVPAAV